MNEWLNENVDAIFFLILGLWSTTIISLSHWAGRYAERKKLRKEPVKHTTKTWVILDKTDHLCKYCALSRLLCPPGHIKFKGDSIVECSEFTPNLTNACRREVTDD